MRWLTRLFGAKAAPSSEQPDPETGLRAGYDCVARGDLAGAENRLRSILEADPTDADALYYLGRLAAADRRDDEAIVLLQRAVELRPREAIFLEALGGLLLAAKRSDEATEAFRAGLALLPESVAMRSNLAAALIESNRREEARPDLEKLRELLPNAPEVHFNLGGIYREYGRAEEAVASYRRALALTPGEMASHSNLLVQLNYIASVDAATIFADHKRFGELFARRYLPPAPDPSWPRRLRIGYLSPDFCNHVVMRFMEPVLASHDHARFEIFCYHNHRTKDPVTARLRKLADRWIDCEEFTAAQIADRIRADRIDILVDLAGHTVGNGLLVLGTKPAPLQATYLGYPNTTGLGAVDYRISDAFADPPGESDRLSIESLLRLPGSYFCYRPEADAPPVEPLPALRNGYVMFGCFNNFAKISGPFLALAARVLATVPNSRLLLKARPLSIESVAQTVRATFVRAGIDPARVELRGWEHGDQGHLSTYHRVDIALDSFPYNGATTTCEAMWMGVPVVSLSGDRHASRAGASLLNVVGLGHLVTREEEEYVAICARLASDVPRLAVLRAGMRERMRHSPLMDESGFTRRLEQCYVDIWEKALVASARPRAPQDASVGELLRGARELRVEGRAAEADAACKEILKQQPAHAEALTLLWEMAFDAESPGATVDLLAKAIATDGGVAAFHHMLGCALQAQGKIEDAAAAFNRALELDPAHAKAANNLGCLLEATGNLNGAAQCYQIAVRNDPNLTHALYNLGNLYKQLGDAGQAAEHIARALALEPAHAEWLCNLASVQYSRLELNESVASLEAAMKLAPDYERAHSQLAAVQVVTGRIREARESLRRSQELKTDPATESWLLLLEHYFSDADPQASFQAHLAWADRHARRVTRVTDHRSRPRAAGRRINVGYLSPDFNGHPVSYFIEPVLAAHDRGAFNVFCYSNSERADEVTARLRSSAENWRDTPKLTDEELVDRIYADGIDVLVDLAGHTGGGRLQVFARKPAPVQVTWLGYPNTTGLETMDYRLSDAIADPPGLTERFHSEQLVRLPRGFLCYAPPEGSPEVRLVPASADGRVTFACFNNLAKVTPEMTAIWAELLRSLPGARLILKNYGLSAGSARRDLRASFEGHGIDSARVELRPAERSLAEHLSRYGEVDIALDVFPYNGTTTTCEALWMGVPVVTLAGSTHVSRVSASILERVGLADLVAHAPEQYLDIAQRLAADVERRRALRAGMRARMQSSPLLDAAGFARDLESAFREMLAKA
jgi:predicted O-linked N-acetylglucosamine transferase (SPINDLY family)